MVGSWFFGQAFETVKYNRLGPTDIEVSALCLGTMTFGEQNTENEGHAQLDAALDAGINFVDTAEMYPVPANADTYGATERIVGNWLRQRGNRQQVILATKAAGPATWLKHIRDGRSTFDRKHLTAALNGSLKRLQTDYIDLYQLHWPDRPTNYFGQLGYKPAQKEPPIHIDETLETLEGFVRSGKVRYVGLSNETPWGLMTFLNTAKTRGGPTVASIQNPYNLLNRTFDIGLAEVSHRERVGLLAYSPLGFGTLTGKYLAGARPPGARLTLFKHYQRYSNARADAAINEYFRLAKDHGIGPAELAIAFIISKPYVSSAIIGATRLEQLRENLGSWEIKLSKDLVKAIDAIHLHNPNPCP